MQARTKTGQVKARSTQHVRHGEYPQGFATGEKSSELCIVHEQEMTVTPGTPEAYYSEEGGLWWCGGELSLISETHLFW